MSGFDEIWEFLPAEDDEEEGTRDVCAEELALHLDEPAEWGRTFDDVARRDVDAADEDWFPITVADDEDDGVVHRDDEREPDVEELLERQHVAFAPSTEQE